MLYYSTNKKAPLANFKEATINGQPADSGLYFPQTIPLLPKNFLENIKHISREEIAFKIIQPYVDNTIDESTLQQIVSETINFNFPLTRINEQVFSLELFHGPTLAFKDVGARFMSRCMGHFVKDNGKHLTVLVATSGDTGGAVANGFFDVEGVNVVILYPSKKVSSVQEAQLTSPGKNITAIEIDGSFDDCQRLVKLAFADSQLKEKMFLTSANSINVARWLPQQFYYFFAYRQWNNENHPPVISVPSGNFGNISAGLLAYASGLPAKHFIAACNANDAVPRFFQSQAFEAREAVATISNAMDVGNPSNFIRMMEIFKHRFDHLKNVVSSISISDEETIATIKQVFEEENYLLDPHGAVAYAALHIYLQQHKEQTGIVLETAHPIKFYNVIEPVIKQSVEIPDKIKAILNIDKKSILMKPEYKYLKEYLNT